MTERGRVTRVVMAGMAAVVLVPAAALAGKRAVSGDQSLQLRVSLKPARAGAKGAVLSLEQSYVNPKQPGQQPPYNSKTITFRLANGLVVHPHSAPQCRESVTLKAKAGGGACPASSKVGTGTVVINYRPFVPTLITGTVTDFNGVDDGGYGGFPKGSPEIVLYVKTSLGVNATEYFHLVKHKDGSEMLTGTESRPARPGVQSGNFTLQDLKLTVHRSSRNKPYITNPPTCQRHWLFSLTTTNYFGQPPVTARDAVKCTR